MIGTYETREAERIRISEGERETRTCGRCGGSGVELTENVKTREGIIIACPRCKGKGKAGRW